MINRKELHILQSRCYKCFTDQLPHIDDNSNGSVQFCLSVTSRPDLILTRIQSTEKETIDDEEFYVLGKTYEFKCEISGNPEPDNVYWVICDESKTSCTREKKYSSSVSKTLPAFRC